MIILFVGVPGSGKSLAMQDTVRLLNRSKAKLGCVIIDRTNEWALLSQDGGPNERWRGDAPSIALVDIDGPEDTIREAMEFARDNGTTVVFQTDKASEVGAWVRRIGFLAYVDDEIDLTARKQDWDDNPLRAFVHTGRHLANDDGYMCEVHILGACRRIQNVHTDLSELASEAYIFRCQGKNTMKRLIDEGWAETDDDLDAIRRQPDLHFHKWTSSGDITQGYLTPIGKEKHEPSSKARRPIEPR